MVWKKWLLKALQCYGQMNRDLKRFAETQQKQISYLNVG
jgi:hypothetical protein